MIMAAIIPVNAHLSENSFTLQPTFSFHTLNRESDLLSMVNPDDKPQFIDIDIAHPDIIRTTGGGHSLKTVNCKNGEVFQMGLINDPVADPERIHGPSVDYRFKIEDINKDSIKVFVYTMPPSQLKQDSEFKYGISIDGGKPVVFNNFFRQNPLSLGQMSTMSSLMNCAAFKVEDGKHRLTLHVGDPGIIITRILIIWGDCESNIIEQQTSKAECSNTIQTTYLYGDDVRIGRPYSKDPHVIHYGDCYFMYYTIPPYEGIPNSGWNIGIALSKDLTNWKRIGEITPMNGCEYERNGLCAPAAIVRNDTIHLFYQTYGNRERDAICHAWSTDGINFSRNSTNPIFHPTGDWNCGRAIDAEVCEYKGKYFLYFASRDKAFERQLLGVATAPIYTNFNREDWTQAADYSILQPQLPWEGLCIEGPSIAKHNGKLYMFYAGSYNNVPQQIGMAVSDDGINWKRISDQPFLPNGKAGDWNTSESGHPHIFTDNDGSMWLFFQGNNDNGFTWYISRKRILWDNDTCILK